MTAPRFAICRCTHGKDDHDREGFTPQCTAAGCTCLQYRPNVAVAKPVTSPIPAPAAPAPAVTLEAAPVMASVEQVVAAGKRSTVKRTSALAGKIEGLVADLRQRVAAEREEAEARRQRDEQRADAQRKVAALEKQLADARAALGVAAPRKPGPRPVAAGGHRSCPECGRDDLVNLGVHRFRAHGVKAGAA